jgi:uncharacterized protein HemX
MSKSKSRFIGLLLIVAMVAVGVWQWPAISNKLENTLQNFEADLVESDIFGKQPRQLASELHETKLVAEDLLDQLVARLVASQDLSIASGVIPAGRVATDAQLIIYATPGEQLQTLLNTIVAINQDIQGRLQQFDIESPTDYVAQPADIIGVNYNLSNLSASIDALPLLMSPELTKVESGFMPVADSSLWSELAYEIGQDVGVLVTIHKVSNLESQLLSPSHIYFLHEGLRLNLLLMRLSLFSHDDSDFDADLEATEAWINQNYHKKSEAVIGLLQVLDQLRNKEDQ